MEKTIIKNRCPRSETFLRSSEVSSGRCPYCWRDDLNLFLHLVIPVHSKDTGPPDPGVLWNHFLGRPM